MTKEEKVEIVRNNIIDAAQVYLNNFIGKKFLYVFGNEYIEVRYKVENFMHLTGTDSRKLNAVKFYEKSKDRHLKRNQMFFSNRYPLKTAMGKSCELKRINVFRNTEFYVIKDFSTEKETFDFCFSDYKITLGFIKDSEIIDGEKVTYDYYVPQTLRINENICEEVDYDKKVKIQYILSKIDDKALYSIFEFGDKENISSLPENIRSMIQI
mgnify:CR=1 FL=1